MFLYRFVFAVCKESWFNQRLINLTMLSLPFENLPCWGSHLSNLLRLLRMEVELIEGKMKLTLQFLASLRSQAFASNLVRLIFFIVLV